MKNTLEVVQKQKQQLSPNLVHSMNVLQMGYFEMVQMLNKSLMENPFFEVDGNPEVSAEFKDTGSSHSKVKKNNGDVGEFDIPDNKGVDLKKHVMRQLLIFEKDKKDHEVFSYLADSLDSRGFLMENINYICEMFDLSSNQGMHYLKLLQSVEPKGIGARNLKECLMIQLMHEYEDLPLAEKIIDNYLEYVASNDYKSISKSENVSIAAVKEAVYVLKALNPIPANGFSFNDTTTYIVPDAYIEVTGEKIDIEINNGFENKLKISSECMNIYKMEDLDKECKDFLAKKLYDYKLVRYYTRRRKITLRKLIVALVSYQEAYFRTGKKISLKPLRLLDLEMMTGLHSSTISRALKDKYYQCDFGTFPLKTLVPRTYSKGNKAAVSREMLKEEIRQIILNEDKQNPYSDKQIQDFLIEEGFDISRRSVSQYRIELNISSSNKRREN